ncbi:MAG: Uma2 family endonuclease [Planctomycetaceae bacterium]|nr:Uma2 family endonuclease [Planctomycetaceae bacterium]
MTVETLSPPTASSIRRGPPIPGLEPEWLVRLNVDQYAAMIPAGVIAEGAPIELLNGIMRWKNRAAAGEPIMTIGKRHVITVNELTKLLTIVLQHARCFVQSQSPISLSQIDEPEPDVCVVAGSPRDERKRHATPDEILLIVEVADSSLQYDRGEKRDAYAVAGVPEYWIVNLIERHVEVYRQPDPGTGKYLDRVDHGLGDTVSFSLADDEIYTIAIDQFLA